MNRHIAVFLAFIGVGILKIDGSVHVVNDHSCTVMHVHVKQLHFSYGQLVSCNSIDANADYGQHIDMDDVGDPSGPYYYEFDLTSTSYDSDTGVASFPVDVIRLNYALDLTNPNIEATIPSNISLFDVSFDSSNSSRFQVGFVGTDEANHAVILWFGAFSPTPASAPNGGAHVRVFYQGTETSCPGPSVVCISPTTQEQATGSLTWENASYLNIPNPNWIQLQTGVGRMVTITIREQFGQLLPAAYDGHLVVQEIFSNATGTMLVNGTSYIEEPDGNLSNGTISDRNQFTFVFGFPPKPDGTPQLTSSERQQWNAGTLTIYVNGVPARNVSQVKVGGEWLYPAETSTASMAIRVRGINLCNTVVRSWSRGNAHPPVFNVGNQ